MLSQTVLLLQLPPFALSTKRMAKQTMQEMLLAPAFLGQGESAPRATQAKCRSNRQPAELTPLTVHVKCLLAFEE